MYLTASYRSILTLSAPGSGKGRGGDSLRSKRFCGFSEHRKTEERDFDNFAAQEMGTSEKWSEGGGGKESIFLLL